MRLLRLELKNFRQHVDTRVDFRPGMTAIVGTNGAGKSTLLESITFALYGKQREKKDTIRFYWADTKKFSVSLTFALPDRRYLVERSNTGAKLLEADTQRVLAEGLDAVTAACQRLLGLTYEQFRNSFCAEQKQLRFLDFGRAAERQEEVARMLGYHRLKIAEQLAGERRKEFSTKSKALEETLGDRVALLADLQAARAERTANEAQFPTLAAKLAELEAKKPATEATRLRAVQFNEVSGQMQELFGQSEGLKKAKATAEERLAEAQKELEELNSLIPTEAEYQRFATRRQELERLREAHLARQRVADEVATLATEIDALGKQIDGLNAPDLAQLDLRVQAAIAAHADAEARLNAAVNAYKEQVQQAQLRLATTQTGAKQKHTDLAKAEERWAMGICPECGQPLREDYEARLAERRREVAQLDAAVERARAEFESLKQPPAEHAVLAEAVQAAKADHTNRQTERQNAAALDAQIRTLNTQRDAKLKLRSEKSALLAVEGPAFSEEEWREVDARLTALKPRHERYLQVQGARPRWAAADAQLTKAKTDFDAAKTAYAELKQRRADLGFATAEDAAAALAAAQRLQSDIEATLQSQKHLEETRKRIDESVARAEVRLAEMEARLNQINELKGAELLHGEAAKHMRNLRNDLNLQIGPELAIRASENLSLLTGGRYDRVHLSPDFEAVVDDDGIRKDVISGGEEDVLALALRLALSELIQERQGRPLSLLILDEVFGSLDAERRNLVLSRLTALKGRFDQILVISHVEEINQVADQCLFVVRQSESKGAFVSDIPVGQGNLEID